MIGVVAPAATPYNDLESRRDGILFGFLAFSLDVDGPAVNLSK